MKHILIASALLATPVLAVTTFTENFTSDNADWDGSIRGNDATWVASGGPTGDGYISSTIDLSDAADGDSLTGVRGEFEFGPPPTIASGGAFVGDWISDQVVTFSAYVRHDAATPATVFVRFADPVNFPGAIAVNFTPVFANTWTEITIAIDASNPQFVGFEGSTFESVFDSIGDIQIGLSVPTGLGGSTDPITFDVDSPSIVTVPEPSTAVLGFISALVFTLRRKR